MEGPWEDLGMLRIISPPLGKIRPWIEILITMVRGEIFDVEDVAHGVLVSWNVDLVGIVVVVDTSPTYQLLLTLFLLFWTLICMI